MMQIKIKLLTDDTLLRRACEMTLRPGQTSKASFAKLLAAEHSPIRARIYWIELLSIPTFVSVHLTRHSVGITHFVQSNRDDRGGDEVVTRETPVNHGMIANAQALLAISRKRLCYASHRKTVGVWMRVKRAMRDVDPVMAEAMVPECVVRGFCPEMRECKAGCANVLHAYRDSWHCKKRREVAYGKEG